MKPTALDIVIILTTLVLIVFSAVWVYGGEAGPLQVRITSAYTNQEWIYPLTSDQEIAVPGPLGLTYIHIHDGQAAFTDSPCPEKTCVLAGAISIAGAWNACLPNRVFVRIEGKQELDDVSY